MTVAFTVQHHSSITVKNALHQIDSKAPVNKKMGTKTSAL
jgi:hypothetical protein